MNEKTMKTIGACITYLQNHGYEVREREGNKVDKWAAYRKEGMSCILHGRVVCDYVSSFCIRRKNGVTDMVSFSDVVEFFENKQQCYSVR